MSTQQQKRNQFETKKRDGLIDNPYINDSSDDVLFHLAIAKNNDLPSLFGDVKFVCMGGTARRMKEFANFLRQEFEHDTAREEELIDLAKMGYRFSMYKIGSVICINHGMGYPSVTIVLHEIIKLLHYANVKDPILFRIGTSGGVEVPEGTVVITEKTVNDYFEEYMETPVLGKRKKYPALLDQNLVAELKEIASRENLGFPVLVGKTVSLQHFYEGIGYPKASFCECNDEDRKNYYELLKKNFILNLEMESIAIAAITHRLKIKSAVVTVVTNDIKATDNNTISVETRKEWESRPQKVIFEYIKHYLTK